MLWLVSLTAPIFYSPVVVKQGGAVAQVFLLSLVWLLCWSQ